MKRVLSVASAVGGLLVAGCEQQRPSVVTLVEVLPLPSPAPSPASVPYVDPGFPAAPAGALVYGRTSPSTFPGSQRYVFHQHDDRFSLQFWTPHRVFEYVGRYAVRDATITLTFDSSNLAGPWLAEGTLHAHSLVVAYNVVMGLADFEDGVFVRVGGGGTGEGAVSW